MEKKYLAVKEQITSLVCKANHKKIWDIHELERIRGRLISWIIVIPDMRIYIRQMNVAVARAYDTSNFNLLQKDLSDLMLAEELMLWTRVPHSDLKRKWLDDRHVVARLKSFTISTDASGFAAGLAFGPQRDLQYRTFTWNLDECAFAIHYKVSFVTLLTFHLR